MEISTARWFSEMGGLMEDCLLFNQYQMTPIDHHHPFGTAHEDLNFQSFSSSGSESYNMPAQNNIGLPPPVEEEEDVKFRPAKQLKTAHHSWTSDIHPPPRSASSSFSSQIISFDSTSPPAAPKTESHFSGESVKKVISSTTNTTRSPFHAQDHVLAERKRREKLSQRFIALSTLLPRLKKTDKASILGDAIKELKQMQEQVKSLEEQVVRKTVESAVVVNKTRINYSDNDRRTSSSSSDENSLEELPEIEAKVSDKDFLIRIHCEKTKGCIGMIMSQIERLHLSIVSSNVLPFGTSTLHITVLAKMEEGDLSVMTAKEVVKNLRQTLLN